MTEPLMIEMRTLREAVNRVLDHVEQVSGSTVTLTADYYWHLPPDDSYNLAQAPPDGSPLVGQLADDVQEVTDLLDRPDQEIFVWHDLAHIVGVLQRIAAQDRPG